ncbi:MAG: SgcJ/EcaC family oxidoreductase [Acidobacteria bacterium]|nr:MAG: SgcJ/EcaC family oxidoreductase [Acidobacteriota bacterium]REK09741.1 MAG: SgcJ/EcaC family oxidoreductase [Acidobacteriota bacterium]
MLRRSALALVAAALVMTGLACAPQPESAESELPVRDTSEENLAAIRGLVADYGEAYNTGDEEMMANLFTEDAILMPPDETSVDGRLLIRNRFATIFATYEGTVQLNVDETRFSGDFGLARGTWALSLTPVAGGASFDEVGKWLNVLERQGGRWRISRSIWNRNAPSPRSTS